MSLNEVLNRFTLVSGLNPREVSKWVFVVMDCIKYFESKMVGRTFDDIDVMRLSHACAVYAYYKYTMYSVTKSSESFKAGDVEISTSTPVDAAKSMWEHEKTEISDLMDFEDFMFCKVRA